MTVLGSIDNPPFSGTLRLAQVEEGLEDFIAGSVGGDDRSGFTRGAPNTSATTYDREVGGFMM